MIAWVVCLLVYIVSINAVFADQAGKDSVVRVLERAAIEYKYVTVVSNGLLSVDLSEGNIQNLSVLKGLPISVLSLRGTEVIDLSPLSGMPLTVLDVSSTLVSNMTPLTGIPLRMLNCSMTKVDNLDFVKGMPLSVLVAAGTRISSLKMLGTIPLNSLDVSGTPIDDLSPLRALPLEALRFSPERIKFGITAIREMKSLIHIGVGSEVVPAKLFWERYDKGEFDRGPSKLPLTPEMMDSLERFKRQGVLSDGDMNAANNAIRGTSGKVNGPIGDSPSH